MYRFDNDNVVIAMNGERISKYLGIQIKNETRLTDNLGNIIISDFINKYEKYFKSNKIDDIKEFYQLTGLMLTHIFNVSDTKSIIYSMNNIFRYDTEKDIYKKALFTTHILVVTNKSDNNNNDYYSKVFWNNEKELEIIRCINNSCNKVNAIEKRYNKEAFKYFNKKDIKQVELTLLYNLCILLKNGDFYLDNKLYAKNVDTIWHQDKYNSYLIYKDNKIEDLTSQFPSSCVYKYKKVVYNKYMLATLKNKRVGITQLVDQIDCSVLTTIYDVDDIYSTRESLYLISGKEKIRIPCWYNTLIVNNNK